MKIDSNFNVKLREWKDKMQLKGYLIEKYNNMTNAYTCNRLVDEAVKQGINLQIVGVHDSAVAEGKIINKKTILEKRDFVVNRYKWGSIKEEINTLAEKSYNPLLEYNCYLNKYEQVKRLRSKEFLIPKYLLVTSLLPFHVIADFLGLPFVAKGLKSSMGQQVYQIEREEDFKQLSQKYGMEKEWLCEEFIHTSYGRDMRFYSIRGEVAACMERRSKGDFRANVALGADVVPFEITPKIRQIAKDIYNQTNLDFLGIDLLFGEEKPYFCEINVMPGIEGIEKATGVNVAKKIISTIREDFEKS